MGCAGEWVTEGELFVSIERLMYLWVWCSPCHQSTHAQVLNCDRQCNVCVNVLTRLPPTPCRSESKAVTIACLNCHWWFLVKCDGTFALWERLRGKNVLLLSEERSGYYSGACCVIILFRFELLCYEPFCRERVSSSLSQSSSWSSLPSSLSP